MEIIVETPRLILRNFTRDDVEALFSLDSDPRVHTYLGNNPITTMQQAEAVVAAVIDQYKNHGIARWAAIEKQTGDFIGWSGLKFVTEYENNHINYYDVGYRLKPGYWNKGYATESAKAAINYGFSKLNVPEIIGAAHVHNRASRKILEKCGLTFVEKFYWRDIECDWLKIKSEQWRDLKL